MQIFIAFRNRLDQSTPLPCIVRMTRIAPRKLDSDNLQSAFKYIRDEIADQIIPGLKPGRADNDDRISWEYDQQKGKSVYMKLEIFH